MRSNCLAWLSRCSYYKKEVVGAVLLLGLASAQAQNFLGNKKFKDTEVNANSQTELTFDLFNSTEGTLTATVKDTLPVTAPAGQLWFSTAGAAVVVPGSAIGTCTQGVITYGDFLDAPTNSKAQTLTITNAAVPPRPSGTTDPNCSIRVPVFTGAVSSDSNVTNFVPGANATAVDASSAVHTSNDFSATVRVRAPVNPLLTTKRFNPTLVVGGANTRLTIEVKNNTSNPSVALSGVNLADSLPPGMTATGTPTFSPDCGVPTTTLADPAIVNMTGAIIAAGKTCQITVDVMAPNITGALTNTIAAGQVTATGGYANQVAAEAVLNVRSEIKITKAFGNSGGTSQWHTVDAPAPANLHGVEFKTTPATAEVGQPVPVRVYFSNPSSTPLTGGRLVDTLPGNTVSVAGSVTGTCSNLPATALAAGLNSVEIAGFSVPAASSGGSPGSCYVQFYVKTTDTTNPATNALSVAAGGDVTFTGITPGDTLFPTQATSAELTTTAPAGPGPYDGKVSVQKGFITSSASTLYSGSAQNQAARINKGEKIWMRIGVTNTRYDVDYESGSIIDRLPAGLKVTLPLQKLIMQNPPAPSGNGAVIANAGCPVPGDISVVGQDITYSGWKLLNAAGPNNTSPRNVGCVAYILLESDDVVADAGSDSINTIRANEVQATVVGTTRTVTAIGDVSARAIVRSDLDTEKSFTPAVINMGNGAVTRLKIQFTNKDSAPITGLGVTDDLPSSAAFGVLSVATPANVHNTCLGTVTATPGSTSVVLAGGEVAANSACVVEVDVVRTGGTVGKASVKNSIPVGAVTNAQGQSNFDPIEAELTKSGDVGISLVKSFSQSSALGGRAVPLTLDFRVEAKSTTAQDQIKVTDVLPAGMLVAQNPNLTTNCQKADGSPADVAIAADRASFTVSGFRFDAYTDGVAPHNRCQVALSMILTTTGNKTNRIDAGAITTDVLSTNPSSTEATLSTQPNTTLEKKFSPSTVKAGIASDLTLTIVNVNTVARTDFYLTDSFPAGMVVAGAASTTCGDGVLNAVVGSDTLSITGADVAANGSCTITVPVKAMKEGSYTNGSSNITAINYIDKTETTDTLEVEPAPPSSLKGIPTLGEWALILLSMCMAGLGFYRLRRANI